MPGGGLRLLPLSISEATDASAREWGSLCTLNLCFPSSLQELSLQAGSCSPGGPSSAKVTVQLGQRQCVPQLCVGLRLVLRVNMGKGYQAEIPCAA